MADGEVPLFPLKAVLCPGGRLLLQVFEARYLDMVASCLKHGRGFGVVAIRSGSEVGAARTYSVGTEAAISAWDRTESGLLALTVVGRRRFRLFAVRRQRDGLYLGRVEYLSERPPTALPDEHRPAAEYLGRLMRKLGGRYDDGDMQFDDAAWVARRLTELLPLEMQVKQSLLECEDPVECLATLAPVIRRLRSAPA
jgi:hypothetical protein